MAIWSIPIKEMRIIACNYQWIFNPFIRENFLQFIDEDLNNCILVLDECHNVIDMATEINSDRITPYSLRICLKDLELFRSPSIMQKFVKILLNHLEKSMGSSLLNVFSPPTGAVVTISNTPENPCPSSIGSACDDGDANTIYV